MTDEFLFVLICAATALAVFGFDLTQPLGVAGSVPYVVLILLALVGERRATVFILASLASVLTVAGYFLSMPAAPSSVVITNRILALLAIWSVAATISMVITHRVRMQEMVNRDVLTGLYSRRYLFEALQHEINVWRREARPLSLIMLDIDYFKSINDRYGHQAGDRVLQGIAAACRDCLRASDLTCRFGGEEFALVLPNTNLDEAAEVAERLRICIGSCRFQLGEDDARVTASLGLAEMSAKLADAAGLIAAADNALYHSKRGGRDCTHIADTNCRHEPIAV